MHLNEQLAAYVRGKKVAFIGAGVSHKELIPQFVEMGAKVTLCDKKPNLEAFGEYGETLKQLGIGLSLGENYMDGFEGQDIIMRTPGFEFYTPALQKAHEHGAELSSEMELFFKYCPCEKVAVTGSDGKTTTTSLIAAMFEAAGRTVHLGGNIGRALLPILGEVKPEDEAVVELSSFQLISMDQSPNVAVVTNVTPNHLDHHKDMAEYINAKRNILLWQQPPCRAVLGYENDVSRGMKADCKGEQVWFTRLHDTDNGAFLRKEDDMLCMAENGVVTPVLAHSEMKLRGLHNVENLLAAIAAALPTAVLFIAIGLLCGACFNDKQVGGVCGALLTNVSAWLSGTWFDIALVGGVFQAIAECLPFFHAVQAGRYALAGNYAGMWPELLWVGGYALVCFAAAVFVFMRKMYADRL